ncbi:DUF2452 domain-containing protein [Sandaracinus amylolyticus]|uniref:DUF2452 domain-containing protein n=1 Tax=Sandaracinus amylolyticus TaxID=927083 RepID=A0A0F6YHN0_9BACT|nr:DUF2452 domain-containing protein [Sandaracinus amylolyticus]AKF05247.1 Hypothetical protein DB32_002396 [Sandaracinus amylolyticus]
MSDDTKRDEGGKHLGPASTSPYPMSRLAPTHDLVDVAKRIADADAMIGATASAKLRVIADQIQALQEEARRILEDTRKDLDLHRARCNFVRRPGQIYHLYRRADGELWFSMIGPVEWAGRNASEFVGSYRLELDQSWTRVDQGDDTKDTGAPAPQELVRRLLGQ